MKLTCALVKSILKDFNSLWTCKQMGNTVEISTPYLLPDSTLFSVFITERNGRFIVSDNGSVSEILSESCPLPNSEIADALKGFASQFEIRECLGRGKQKLFFKDCANRSLLSGLVFKMANFAMTATTALVAPSSLEPDIEPDERFRAKADEFLKDSLGALKITLPSGMRMHRNHPISQAPGVKFSAAFKTNNRIWLVAYVTGSDLTYFNRSIGVTKMNFDYVWGSSLRGHLGATIPLVNTKAPGYKPEKLGWQLKALNESSQKATLHLGETEKLAELLHR
jgi:hypothetical protein